ncbi:DUF1573 domain-containing protein [Thermoflavimicrobium daqui]|jgi:hypothetical protein|uniref:DUF1573 domain-containing protein n=1 Tax=Thermoflavimicrobium daqui TaxID=2137476 RepID=A0A364K303_9BACL|nr:DUF1573 domain-containing protein [Thermoflavimicrobium daqui]RAL23221.1 DUF1573 domain-containing protein [Thermoflavimicrobium daqui]
MSEDYSVHSFQHQVSELLLRHRSFLDVISKFQESNARVNRALMKSITECGCIKVQGERQPFPQDAAISLLKKRLKTHLDGKLCDNCLDIVKAEMGKNLFYLAALCNLLEMNLSDVIDQESSKLNTLGVFNLR